MVVRDDDVVGDLADVREQEPDQRHGESGADHLGEQRNTGTDAGAMPAKVSVKTRPDGHGGVGEEVEQVNQYAAPM